MPTDTEARAPGTLIAGRFRIIRQLGAGGMGAVFEIEHEITKHRRALKLLHASMRANAGVVERFLREASAAGRIGDPHIVETFDAGTLDSGEPYVVMELLEGETLARRLERKGRLELPELADLVGQACAGVAAAHAASIVHRDLKPENLFLVERDGATFLKLLDFGISKFDVALTGGQVVTKEGTAVGTPLYMPPEQVRGERDLDGRADVYALGVILFECAAGVPPFEAASLQHLAVLIHEGRAKPLDTLRPDLPETFHALVRRAMAVDRDARVGTPRELGSELAEIARALAQRSALGRAHADEFASTAPAAPARGRPSDAPAAGAVAEARTPSARPSTPPAARPSSAPPARDSSRVVVVRDATSADAALTTTAAVASSRLRIQPVGPAGGAAPRRSGALRAASLVLALGLVGLAIWALRGVDPAAAPQIAITGRAEPPPRVPASIVVVPGAALDAPAPSARAAEAPSSSPSAAPSAASASARAPSSTGSSGPAAPPRASAAPRNPKDLGIAKENPFR